MIAYLLHMDGSQGTVNDGPITYAPNLNLPEGRDTGFHTHSFPHSMLCVAGRVRAWLGDEAVDLGPWQAVEVPAGISHNAQALEDGSGFICVWTRADAEGEGV